MGEGSIFTGNFEKIGMTVSCRQSSIPCGKISAETKDSRGNDDNEGQRSAGGLKKEAAPLVHGPTMDKGC